MRITVLTTGEVVFEDANVDDALALVKQLRNGSRPVNLLAAPDFGSVDEYVSQPIEEDQHPYDPYEVKVTKKARAVKKIDPVVSLPRALGETWEWMRGRGPLSTSEVAEGLGITVPNASFRVRRLVERGVLHRIGRGVYQVGGAAGE